MFKLMKYILIFIAIVMLLAIITAISLLLFVDPNEYKAPIIKEVNEKTGRLLAINGNISWSFFPTFGLQADNITLADNPQFSTSPLFSIQKIDIRVKLLPLLKKSIEASQIKVDGLKINLITNKMGNNNWQTLPNNEKSTAPLTVPSQNKSLLTQGKLETKEGPLNFSINNITIKNAELTWTNQQTGEILTLSPMQVNAKHINILNKKIKITTKFTAAHNKPEWQGEFSIKTKVNTNPENAEYKFNSLEIDALLSSKAFSNAKIKAHVSTQATFDTKTHTLQFNEFNSQVNNLQATGKINISQVNNTPTFKGELHTSQFNMQEFLQSIGIQLPKENSSALTQVQSDLNFNINNTVAKFSNVKAVIDKSIVTGELQLAKNQPGFINLTVDQINLDSYLDLFNKASTLPNKLSTTVANTVTISNMPTQSTHPVSSNFLQTMNLTGQMNIEKLTINQLNIENLHTNINANHAIIKLQPLTAKLYSGDYQGQLNIDLNQTTPHITGTANLNNIHLNEVFKDLGSPTKIDGSVQLITRFTARGTNKDVWLRSLNGEANLQINNGVIKGLNMMQGLQQVYTQIKHKSLSNNTSNSETTFSNLSADFLIQNGIASNKDFYLASPILSATGNGTINLMTTAVNYNLEAKLLSSDIPELLLFQESTGGSIPIIVTGTIGNLRVAPNLPSLLSRVSGSELGEKAKAIGEQLKSFFKK